MWIIEDSRQQADKHNIKHEGFTALGVDLVRCKLPWGDYANIPRISIDTKNSMDEIAGNICGKEHQRFINECKAAKEAGCKLIVLVENTLGITDISEVHTWINPRVIYSPNCVQGARLQKAMETISERYGVTFMFCRPEESAQIIKDLLNE
jgi:ribosome-associated protein